MGYSYRDKDSFHFHFNTINNELYICKNLDKMPKNCITLKTQIKPDEIMTIKPDIAKLTKIQRLCLVLLSGCILTKQSCIIQGPKSSGKSYIIRLFAKMLGKKLNVFQMNNETDISIFAGHFSFLNHFTDEEINELKISITNLERIPEIQDYISMNINSISTNEWNNNTFSDLIKFISNDDFNKTQKSKEIINKVTKDILNIIQSSKRFHFVESPLTRAIIKGEWVLFDGIESASPEFIAKITSLCGFNPELDLSEYGNNLFFSRYQRPNSTIIHDDFQMFFTYDCTKKQLDSSFLGKNVMFTLYSLDNMIKPLQKILPRELYFLINHINHFDDFQLIQNSLKLALKILSYCHNDVDENLYLSEQVYSMIKLCFQNSLYYKEGKKVTKHMIIDELSKITLNDLHMDNFRYLDDEYGEGFLYSLFNIQIHANDKSTLKIYLNSIINTILNIRISDICFIQMHIKDTIKIFNDSNKYECPIYLKIIEKLFDEILKEKYFLNISNDNIRLTDLYKENKSIKFLSRFMLINELVRRHDCFCNTSIPQIYFNDEFICLMKSVINMKEKCDLNSFLIFITLLNSNTSLFSIIKSIFPYEFFEKSSFRIICYFLPVFCKLHESQTTFRIIILDQILEFKYDHQSIFLPIYAFEKNDELIISTSTEIQFFQNKYNISIKKDKINQDKTITILINLTYYLLLNKYFDLTNQKSIRNDIMSRIHIFRRYGLPRLNLRSNFFYNREFIYLIYCMAFYYPSDLLSIFEKFCFPVQKEIFQILCAMNHEVENENILKFADCFSWLDGLDYSIRNDDISNHCQIHQKFDEIRDKIIYLKRFDDFGIKSWSPDQLIFNLILNRFQLVRLYREINTIYEYKNLLNELIHLSEYKNCTKLIYTITNIIMEKVYDSKLERILESLYWKLNHLELTISPLTVNESDEFISPTLRLLDIICWYSKIKFIFNKLMYSQDQTTVYWILQLLEFPEMNDKKTIELLIKGLFIEESPFKYMNLLNSIINAHFIYKLIKHDLVDMIPKLDLFINNLGEKEQIEDENLLNWMHKNLNLPLFDFSIVLPQFQPNDLLHLLILLLKDINDSEVLEQIKSIRKHEYGNFWSFERIKRFLHEGLNQKSYKKFNKETYRNLLLTIEIAKMLEYHYECKFTFNDLGFLEENWFTDESFINKYPYFVFYICKNYKLTTKIRNYLKSFHFSENELPFCLLQLRIMSRINFVKFECHTGTDASYKINKNINQIIVNDIKQKMINNGKIGTKWINILLSTPPLEIVDQKYQMLHQFIINIANNEILFEEFIHSVLPKIMEYYDLDYIFNLKIDSKDHVINFIKNPSKIINKQQQFEELYKLKEKINPNLKLLLILILKEKEKERQKYNEIIKNDLLIMKEKIAQNINEYLENLKKLTTNTFNNFDEFQECCNKVLKLVEKIPDCFDKNEKELTLYQFNKNEDNSHFIKRIEIKDKNDCIDIYSNTFYYFNDKYMAEKTIKDLFDNDTSCISKIDLFSISKTFQIDDYCKKHYYSPELSKITFGNSLNTKQFIDKINQFMNYMDKIISNIESESTSIEFDELYNQINELINICSVDFSDNTECAQITSLINKVKNIFIQFNKYLQCSEFKHVNQNSMSSSINKNYDLPIPKENHIDKIPSSSLFKNISNTNILYEFPILSTKDGSIACCFDSLNIKIGPIISSLYSRDIKLSFISFIEEQFSMEIKTDEKYLSLFTSKKEFYKDDFVQLFISLPNDHYDTIESIEIDTKIHFTSPKLKELILPCKFSIDVIPLAFLISCNQYPLSYKGNLLYLCVDRLISTSKITFNIQNFYLNDKIEYSYQISILDDSFYLSEIESKINDEGFLELKIPDIKEIKKINCEIRIIFSNEISIIIIINSVVIPFDFEFEIFDQNLKKFVKETTVYYSLNKTVPLYFRINFPCDVDDLIGKINYSLPPEIEIKEYKNINKKFDSNGETQFEIILGFNSNVTSKNDIQNSKYFFTVNINGIEKIIYLNFELSENVLDPKYYIMLNGIKINEKEEDQHEAFLFTEKSYPIPKTRSDKPQYITTSKNIDSNLYNQINQINFELPPILIPKEKEEMSLLTLNNIYFSCIKGTLAFPTYIAINLEANNFENIEKEAIEYFSKLLNLYNDLPIKDLSFISSTTNHFSKCFNSMIWRFKKAGADFNDFLPDKIFINKEISHEFLQYPEKDVVFEPIERILMKRKLKEEEEEEEEPIERILMKRELKEDNNYNI